MYQTNSFVFNRIGEVVGTFIFGQLGDTLGRRPVFYFSTVIIILGRVMTVFTTSTYWLFAIAAVLSCCRGATASKTVCCVSRIRLIN